MMTVPPPMPLFETQMFMAMLGLVDKGLATVTYCGESLTPDRAEKLWFNPRTRDDLMVALTDAGKDFAAALDG